MEIDDWRKKIDELDRHILESLNKRASLAKEIGHLKNKTGKDFYIPHREKNVITNIINHNKGKLLANSAVEAIYREILNACRSLETRLKVAFFGPEATFTHQAALKNFGAATDYIPVKSIGDVFTEVERMRADYGVVPVENSTEGVVNHTLDMFIESDLVICAEINMQIEECLLSKCSKISDVKRIYSHFQPLAQSRNWLEQNLPGVPVVEMTSSTSEAAKIAAREKGSAAIASRVAANMYKLDILASGIEDNRENFTRFLVIGRSPADVSGHDKTSIMFSIKDKVGALHDMLNSFKKEKINLTKIESRPTKKKAWEYIFFIDFIGHISEPKVQRALKQLEKNCMFLKVLGSYPRAE